ncbi:MAG: ribose-phosphate pyrophosphokinase [Oscillospiraceae bacterium]|jgi:ribose-phosphate pyrophosphokinase|nr:ribose-phosphate pyrophosphokinase [Oscillospiraceae bacterium]
MSARNNEFTTIPYGPLGIITLPGCEELAQKIDSFIVNWRAERESEHKGTIAFAGYQRASYIINTEFIRFGTGEGKAVIHESVRGYDLFILCDIFNYGVTTERYGIKNIPMGPDEHYANLKRAIAAAAGKAHRITVIMPMLYEGRQHKRSSRESLDCALALQELCDTMGVDNILTFDAHDARVQNAIPLHTFENITTVYQMIKAFVNNVENVKIDKDSLMVISPDEGGMSRCIYYSTVLGIELGMFYKRRDYSRVVQGRNPIVAHEFLGSNVEGKDVIVVDDMISSGESMIEVATKLKDLNANRVFVFSAFGLFCNGLQMFDKAFEDGVIHGVFTTNLVYRSPELLGRVWYHEVDMSKFISLIIDTLNHDMSISEFLSPSKRISKFLAEKGFKNDI